MTLYLSRLPSKSNFKLAGPLLVELVSAEDRFRPNVILEGPIEPHAEADVWGVGNRVFGLQGL